MKQIKDVPRRICWEEPEPGPAPYRRVPWRRVGGGVLLLCLTGMGATYVPQMVGTVDWSRPSAVVEAVVPSEDLRDAGRPEQVVVRRDSGPDVVNASAFSFPAPNAQFQLRSERPEDRVFRQGNLSFWTLWAPSSTSGRSSRSRPRNRVRSQSRKN